MKVYKKFAAVLGSALLMGATATVGSAAASSTGANACSAAYRIGGNEGYADIWQCDGWTEVHGTVYDTRSDGRCPLVVGVLSGTGGTVNSDWAGPKGDNSPVHIYAPRGRSFIRVEFGYITC
ncbi:hypothetical protein ACFCZ1_07865 [Streptomyces sp. NPDC056224]|uniref:hypothetical protein n=1 Tax=Streptomyces sp. NPDC056224 TaxID=3345750 RepID=UPI0035DC2404